MPMIGAQPPASIDDETPEAKAARAYYEIMVNKHLARHAWSWATKSVALTYVGETNQIPAYEYSMPSEVLTPRRIEVQGNLYKDWQLRDRKVLTNLYDSSELILIYNWRAPEADWNIHFVDAIIHDLAGYLAMGLLDRPEQGERLQNRAEALIRRAIRVDRRAYPAADTNPDPILIQAWRGGTGSNTKSRLYLATES